MPRYTKTQVTQLSANEQAAIDNINKNFDDIQSAIQDTVSRGGNTPTHMTHDLDMNGKRIINVPAPLSDTDLVRRQDVVGDIALVQSLVNTTTNAAAQALEAAQDVQQIIQDANVALVGDDLALEENSKIRITANNITNVNYVGSNISNVNSVADNIDNIVAVKNNATNINAVNANKTNIDTVAANNADITTVAANISDVNTVSDNISDVSTVSGISSDVTTTAGLAEDIPVIVSLKDDIPVVVQAAHDIDIVEDIASDIIAVADITSDVTSVASNATDITTVATNISDVNTVATDISDVGTVASNISNINTVAGIDSDISAVASNNSNITAVAANESNINAVNNNSSNINAVAGNNTNITAVANNATNINAVNANKTNIDTVAGAASNISTVATNISDINDVQDNLTDISAVASNNTNITAVANNETNINAVAGNSTNINAVNANKTNIDAVAGNSSNITAVANNATNINAVNSNKTNINTVATNISDVNDVADIASSVSTVAGMSSNIASVVGNATNINSVAGDLTNINAVAADLTNIDAASSYAAESKQWAIGDPTEPSGGSAKYWAEQAAQGQIQSDWDQSDSTKKDYIKNKPTIDDLLPTQTSQSGKFLTTNGSVSSWATVDALPSQSGQSGKYLTTNGTDASWGNIPSDPTKANTSLSNLDATGQAVIDGRANTDLSNLTSTGKNIGNWSSNVTNCITYIPQDISLTLSSGTLTVKAGSKVYTPNGVGTFSTTTITTDKVCATSTSAGKRLVFMDTSGNNFFTVLTLFAYSGNTSTMNSTTPISYGRFYNTETNKMYVGSSGSWVETPSTLPVAVVTNDSHGNFTSIDKVFNGFGYIGSTVFALPGVKGLIPDGRNDDGTLKNAEFEFDTVKTGTLSYGAQDYYLCISKNKNFVFAGKTITEYQESKNLVYDIYAGLYRGWGIVGSIRGDANNKLSNFTPKTVFHSLDWNDLEIVNHFRTVVETYKSGTSWYRIWSDGWCEQGGSFKITSTGDHKETINFLKTFANTNYQFFATGKTSSSDLNPGFIAICMVGPNCTTAKVEVKWYTSSYTTTTNDNINWRACGYIS